MFYCKDNAPYIKPQYADCCTECVPDAGKGEKYQSCDLWPHLVQGVSLSI